MAKAHVSVVPTVVGAGLAAASFIAIWLVMRAAEYAYWPPATDPVLVEMQSHVHAAQCAFWLTGKAPSSSAEAKQVLNERPAEAKAIYCSDAKVLQTRLVEYAPIDASNIRLCGTFQFASMGGRNPSDYSINGRFAELNGYRPRAGRHCFEIHLQETRPTEDEDPASRDPF